MRSLIHAKGMAKTRRPATVLSLTCRTFIRGLAHMAMSGDSRIKGRIARQPDPDLLRGWKTENRTVIFIRHGMAYTLGFLSCVPLSEPYHSAGLSWQVALSSTPRVMNSDAGESTWNEVFNKGKGLSRWLGMPVRLARGLLTEALWALTPSVTPAHPPQHPPKARELSILCWCAVCVHRLPAEQGGDGPGLGPSTIPGRLWRGGGWRWDGQRGAPHPRHSEGWDDTSILARSMTRCLTLRSRSAGRSGACPSVVASSNLQRALGTVSVALWDRLKDSHENIVIHSDLQGACPSTFGIAAGRNHLSVLRSLFVSPRVSRRVAI